MFDKFMHQPDSSLDASLHDQTKGHLSRGSTRSRQGHQRRRTSLDNSDLTRGDHNDSSLLQILRRNDVNGYKYGDDDDYSGGSTHKYYSMGISKYSSNHSSNLSTNDDLEDDEFPRKRRHSLNYGISVPTTFLADLMPSKPKGDLDDDCHAGVGRPTNSPTKRSAPTRGVPNRGKDSPKKVPGRSHSTPLTVMANSLIASPNKTTKTQLKRTPISPRKVPPGKAPVMKARHTFDSDSESDSSWVPDDDSFGEAADQEQACLSYIQQDLGASYYFDDEEFFNHHVKPHVVEDDTASLDEVLEELVEEEEIEEELKPAHPAGKNVIPANVVLPVHGSSHHADEDGDDDSDCDSFGEANETELADKEYLQKDLGASCFWGEECPALDCHEGGNSTPGETFTTIGEEDEDEDSNNSDIKKFVREEQPQDDVNEEPFTDPIKPVLEETAPEQAPKRRRSRNILQKFMHGKKK